MSGLKLASVNNEMACKWPIIVGFLGFLSCSIDKPSFQDTEFTCPAENPICPSGYVCFQEICLPPGEAVDPEGEQVGASPGAGSETEEGRAGGDVKNPSEGEPKYGEAITKSFGERLDADVKQVTFDTYIEGNDEGDNHGDEDEVRIHSLPISTGLIRFDLGAIPSDAEVVSAELVLFFGDVLRGSSFEMYALAEAWAETEANYINRLQGVPWKASGAGAASVGDAAVGTIRAGRQADSAASITAGIVSGWVKDADTNFGLRLKPVSWRYCSRGWVSWTCSI